MKDREIYQEDIVELVLHAVLPQYRIAKRYRNMYMLDQEQPDSKALESIETSDETDPLPMELLLDTYDNDGSAQEYLRIIKETDKDTVSLMLIASIARRYVGDADQNLLSYREMIDIGLDGYANAADEPDGEKADRFTNTAIWYIHKAINEAIYKEYLEEKAPETKELLKMIKYSQEKTARENEAEYHLYDRELTEETVALLDSRYNDDHIDLSSISEFYSMDKDITEWLKEVEKAPYLSCEEEERFMLEAKKEGKDIGDQVPGSLYRMVTKIASEYDVFYSNGIKPCSRLSRYFGVIRVPEDDDRVVKLCSMLELLQEGAFGLVFAVRKFEENAGYSIRSLAAWWIHMAIVREILMPKQLLHISHRPIMESDMIVQVYSELSKDHEPSCEELTNAVGPDIAKIHEYYNSGSVPKLDQLLQSEYKQKLHLYENKPSAETLQKIRDMSECQLMSVEELRGIINKSAEMNEYFASLSELPQITEEEEKVLFDRFRKGDRKAKEEIINANLMLSASIANRYFKYQYNVHPDILKYLILDANEGLEQAVENYDASEVSDFRSFAAWYIHKRANEGFALGVSDTNTAEDLYKYIFG